MPLLDGKYEILAERPLGPGVVAFDATTAEGQPVRVVWYELAPEQEAAFERYRRGLRRLARDGLADVVDVVSRPGARYVAWRDTRSASEPVGAESALAARLRDAGLTPANARQRLGSGGPLVTDLPFGHDVAPERTTNQPPPARPSKRRPLAAFSDAALSWLLAAVLFAAALALWSGGFALRTNDRLVTVPAVDEASVEALVEQLLSLGLRVTPVPLASDAPEGTVLALDPAEGSALRPGRSVRVSYAVPAGRLAPTVVPAVLGLDLDAATARLAAAELEVGRVARVHEAAPGGSILAQSEPSGSTVGVGSQVDLVVSLGPVPETTFVPDLVGLEEADARALAVVAGLNQDQISVERLDVRGATPGTVVSQSLAPYRRVVLADAALRLLVAGAASGPIETTGLTNLTGFGEIEARALADDFEVRVSYLEDRNLPEGVVWQSLPPGSSPADGPLALAVNVRPVPIPLPQVTAIVRQPQLREVPYLWFIEPGIPSQRAEVSAITLEGVRTLVRVQHVRGGERVEGAWRTTYPGPVRLILTLNDEPYGGELLVP